MDFRNREEADENPYKNKSKIYLVQRICMAIQRGNTICTSSAVPSDGANLQPIFYLVVYYTTLFEIFLYKTYYLFKKSYTRIKISTNKFECRHNFSMSSDIMCVIDFKM